MKILISFKTPSKIIFTALVFLACLGFASCKKDKIQSNQEIEVAPEIKLTQSNHTWYYFTDDGYFKTDKPQNSPYRLQAPWTEVTRISSSGTAAEDQNLVNKGFAVVNRLGILCFENDRIVLARDNNLFSNRTAGNLVFLNNTPIFSVYKSAFFNDTITDPNYKSDDSQHFFLIQFDDKTKVCYPILHCNNLIEESNSEITDFSWDGLNWYCSIKTISDTKNSFSYVSWKPTISLLDLSPSNAKGNITVKEISQDDFRNTKAQIDYSKAPNRIKNMLSNFSSKIPFQMELKAAGGHSSQTYLNSIENSQKEELKAKAIISQSWSCVIFEDGTLFIEGALSEKHILRNGKAVAIRLPKLPAGYVYSDFTISGTTLYVGWEEAAFYETSRSGFLQVNLEKTLYSKIL
ncbi:MAG: hypothetical protein K5866_08575 [Treponema sp.]|nr:hypothetical protein [Treponema sp.]